MQKNQRGIASAFVASLFLFTLTSFAAENFLILERPQTLVIFNQYQQRATAEEQALLIPFTPFKILNENDVLGDGFTPCMRVEVGGRGYFIEKDDDGTLHDIRRVGFQRTLRDVVVVGDTIEIMSGRFIFSDPTQTQTSRMDEGTRVARVFRQNGLTYVKLIGGNERFGWLDFSSVVAGRDWKKAEKLGASVAVQIQNVLPRIQSKTSDVNAKLRKLYGVLNQKSAGQLIAPQWQVKQVGKTILCTLEPPTERFAETTRALSKSFEGMLLGTELKVSSSGGRIEIR